MVDKWNKKRTKDHQFVNQKLGKSIVLYDNVFDFRCSFLYETCKVISLKDGAVKLYHKIYRNCSVLASKMLRISLVSKYRFLNILHFYPVTDKNNVINYKKPIYSERQWFIIDENIGNC